MTVEVRAAGGVVVRSSEGQAHVLLVHRPRYDDWSFPKGKCDPGESDEDAARREILEESSCVCRLGEELPTAFYTDNKGRSKQVRYWRMHLVEAQPFEPNDEVDELRWCTVAEAAELLTYDWDRRLLDLVGNDS